MLRKMVQRLTGMGRGGWIGSTDAKRIAFAPGERETPDCPGVVLNEEKRAKAEQ